jgi:hypothetical protein
MEQPVYLKVNMIVTFHSLTQTQQTFSNHLIHASCGYARGGGGDYLMRNGGDSTREKAHLLICQVTDFAWVFKEFSSNIW